MKEKNEVFAIKNYGVNLKFSFDLYINIKGFKILYHLKTKKISIDIDHETRGCENLTIKLMENPYYYSPTMWDYDHECEMDLSEKKSINHKEFHNAMVKIFNEETKDEIKYKNYSSPWLYDLEEKILNFGSIF